MMSKRSRTPCCVTASCRTSTRSRSALRRIISSTGCSKSYRCHARVCKMRVRHSVQPLPGTNFIDPKTLARIDNLELLARTVVDGFINGLHRAPYLGLSLDFAEHRAYYPGDDIRRIDWRVFARTDRFYVKEFEADTNSNFTVVLDVSRSMSYRGVGIPKLDYARFLAASLSYFSREQRDRVGMLTFDSDIVDYVPCSAKHLDVVLHTIDRLQPRETGNLDAAMRKAAELLRRRGLVIVISDLYEEPARVQAALGMLKHRGHDVIVFHVLDRSELELVGTVGGVPLDEATSFEDLVKRRRIRNWWLFALRCLALLLLVGAFARPYIDRPAAELAAVEAAREVVVM